MKKRFQKFVADLLAWIRFWRFCREWARQVRAPWPVPHVDREPWSDEDTALAALFFRGAVGSRILSSLERADYDTAMAAVNRDQPGGRDYAAGYASGFRSCVASIKALSAVRTVSEQPAEEPDQGEDSFRARHAP